MHTRRTQISWVVLACAAVLFAGCKPSPPPPAGAVTVIPGSPNTVVPAGSAYTVAPIPFPGAINTTGINVSVTVKTAGGGLVTGVNVIMEILPGKDKVITSMLDAGVDPASTATPPAHYVGTKITSFTDPLGTCTMLLKSTTQGDEDILQITVDPNGGQQKVLTYPYATVVP